MNSLMLSAFLNIGTPQGVALPPEDAPRYIGKALYKELKLDKVMSHIEKRCINVDKYPELGYIGVVVRVVNEKRVSYTWRF